MVNRGHLFQEGHTFKDPAWMEAVVLSLSLLANVMDFACSSAKCARAPSTSFSSAPFYFNMVVHCILYILQQSLSLSGVCRKLFSFGTSDGRSARLASSSRDGNGPRHARANFMVLKNHALHALNLRRKPLAVQGAYSPWYLPSEPLTLAPCLSPLLSL